MQGDPVMMKRRLQTTNYYRLSGYWYFFRVFQGPQRHLGEQFRAGLNFDQVWELYVFDGKLKLLVLRALEKIEVAVRTQVCYYHAEKYGPYAYAVDRQSLTLGTTRLRNGTIIDRHSDFLAEVDKCLERSQEQFIDHFRDNYSNSYPPLWIAAEALTLGCIKRIYDGSPLDIKRKVAEYFDIPHVVLDSWLLTLNTARNVCAHHGRFWNRVLGTAPKMPPEKTYPYFHKPVAIYEPPSITRGGISPKRPPTAFAILSICNHLLLRVDPHGGWAKDVKALLDAFPRVSRPAMGFPQHWTLSPVWADVE